MAFKATLTTIQAQGANIVVVVRFTDDATAFVALQDFVFPTDGSINQAQAIAQITAAGLIYKNNLATLNNLLNKVGTVITI